MVEKRFGALRMIGNIFKVLGIVTVVVGVVVAVLSVVILAMHRFGGGLTSSTYGLRVMTGGGILSGLLALLWGAIGGLFLYGAGEVIHLLIAVEENTRASMLLLRRQQSKPAADSSSIPLPPDSGAAS
jgi:hypothetical protein